MKVLIIATSPDTRGGITSVLNAYRQCDIWKKCHCRWIASHSDKNRISKIFFFLRGWLAFIIALPLYDIVHIHVSEPPSALRKCFFMPFVRIFGKKAIVHFHSFSADTTIKSRWAFLYRYLFGSADAVIALSPYWKNKIVAALSNVSEDKIHVLYNPCISEPFEEKYKKRETVLFAGVLVQRKGYADLLKGFARIAQKYPKWKLVFAGSGELEKAKELTDKFGLSDQVEFAGWVRGREKDKLFKEASIFCLPSYAEGFPMSVLDAWSYGLPVVATPVGGLPDIAVDGKNMLLFPVGDEQALAACLEKVIVDEKLRDELSFHAKNLSENVFDKRIVAAQLEKIYFQIFNS